jgi:hypothetical protein
MDVGGGLFDQETQMGAYDDDFFLDGDAAVAAVEARPTASVCRSKAARSTESTSSLTIGRGLKSPRRFTST